MEINEYEEKKQIGVRSILRVLPRQDLEIAVNRSFKEVSIVILIQHSRRL